MRSRYSSSLHSEHTLRRWKASMGRNLYRIHELMEDGVFFCAYLRNYRNFDKGLDFDVLPKSLRY